MLTISPSSARIRRPDTSMTCISKWWWCKVCSLEYFILNGVVFHRRQIKSKQAKCKQHNKRCTWKHTHVHTTEIQLLKNKIVLTSEYKTPGTSIFKSKILGLDWLPICRRSRNPLCDGKRLWEYVHKKYIIIIIMNGDNHYWNMISTERAILFLNISRIEKGMDGTHNVVIFLIVIQTWATCTSWSNVSKCLPGWWQEQ